MVGNYRPPSMVDIDWDITGWYPILSGYPIFLAHRIYPGIGSTWSFFEKIGCFWTFVLKFFLSQIHKFKNRHLDFWRFNSFYYNIVHNYVYYGLFIILLFYFFTWLIINHGFEWKANKNIRHVDILEPCLPWERRNGKNPSF